MKRAFLPKRQEGSFITQLKNQTLILPEFLHLQSDIYLL
jgi:hypothetical protein